MMGLISLCRELFADFSLFPKEKVSKKDEVGQRVFFFLKSDFIFLKYDAPYETTLYLLGNLVKFFFFFLIFFKNDLF